MLFKIAFGKERHNKLELIKQRNLTKSSIDETYVITSMIATSSSHTDGWHTERLARKRSTFWALFVIYFYDLRLSFVKSWLCI